MHPSESRLNPPGRRVRPSRLLNLRVLSALAVTGSLSACNAVVFNPAGDVARQQGDLVIISTLLMLLIVIPVMAAVVIFAWRYRASNKDAKYDPHWDHSTQLELLIWTAPLLIIICLGAVTWVSTHLLDPYRTLARIDDQTVVAPSAKPLEVEVVALDWKWLFIYPEQGIATVNELVVPTGRQLQFKITSSSVMNSFYVPAMAGQIYAMPGMETRLHAVMNKPGNFVGFSANYSGAGFSHMRFAARSVSDGEFDRWVGDVKAGVQAGGNQGSSTQVADNGRPAADPVPGDQSGNPTGGNLDRAAYLELEKPSEKVPAIRYASVAPDLYKAIVDMCVEPGKMCASEMMAIDARGGLGKEGIRNVSMLAYDKGGREAAAQANANPNSAVRRELAWVRALCRQIPGSAPDGTIQAPADLRSLNGAGLAAPQSTGLEHGQARAPAGEAKAEHVSLISRN